MQNYTKLYENMQNMKNMQENAKYAATTKCKIWRFSNIAKKIREQ